jgi:serine/threonine protein kinase
MPAETSPAIPGYKVLGKLGQGGMATVWKAEQIALGRPIALKVVSAHLVSDTRTRERFLREARISARVVHPNVITCHDAGDAGGQLFMALELVTGGDLRQLQLREHGRLDPWRALRLVHDCLQGLVAIEDAGLIHRDIKPGNIFLDAQGMPKLADLGLAKPSGGADLTMPGMVVGTPSFIAPEQARAVQDLDIRADIYALGATLFSLIAGRPPFPGDDPMGVLVAVLNDPTPELSDINGGCPAEISWLTRSLMAKDRNLRPANARAALSQAVALLEGQGRPKSPVQQPPAKPAVAARTNSPPTGTPTRPVTTDIHRPGATGSAKPVTADVQRVAVGRPNVQIDPAQMALLVRRIIVDQGGLRASLALAPGACFPRWMLDQIIAAAGVCYGMVEASIHAATFPKDVPRRLILARGTPSSPGIAGRSVRNEPIDPLLSTISIEVTADQLQATAFTRPGQVAKKSDLEVALKTVGIRYGLDPEALRRLVDGPPFPSGRAVIARGRAVDHGRQSGYQLTGDVENTTVEAIAGSGNLRKVESGEIIAWWDDGIPAKAGMDVLGRELVAPLPEAHTPESCAGIGCELARSEDGRLALRSRVSGFVQRQADGSVRVVGIFAVDGDVGPDHPPIVTDDVVVIRGSVLSGASITSSSDVVVMGDLEDAAITAGGNIEVDGRIGAGQPIAAGGMIVAKESENRTIMAGSLRIEGEVRNCELRATGDINVRRICGGGITAGGNVRVETVGDADGTTTVLWAGHHLTRAEEGKIAELAAKRADAERSAIMHQRQITEAEINRMQASNTRMQGASFVNQAAAKQMQERLRQLEAEAVRVAAADDQARLNLAQTRQDARRATEKGENARARIDVGVIAHAGVVVKLADGEPEALREPRLKLKLGI